MTTRSEAPATPAAHRKRDRAPNPHEELARTPTVTSEPWEVSARDFPEGGSAAEILAFLLRYAVLAPSGHNTQPWLFAVRDDTVDLCADRTQALAVVDPDDRELTISCGAALLNLRVALRRFGYRDDACELLPDSTDRDLLAQVRLVEGEPPSREEEALFDAIPQRRATRAAFSERRVPAQYLERGETFVVVAV